jgi:DNA replication licensing factor MCM3
MYRVKPQIQTSVLYFDETKKGLIKHYTDDNNLAEMAEDAIKLGDGRSGIPTEDANRNPLTTEFGYCVYKDYQVVTIQEMPENAPPG